MLTVGQKLWLVPMERHYGQPCEVVVTKIGRKWASISGYYRGTRIDINTLIVWHDWNGKEFYHRIKCPKSNVIVYRADRA